jgi:hypothetical protein
MPTVLHVGRFRFFFYSEEGSEPPHMHVEAAENRAKYWLRPIQLTWNEGFRSGELRSIVEVLSANQEYLLGEWNAYFGF